ncbi:aminotransferase class I/II-fold pyridoxal phosphate-dependent enzyme [Brachybacterium hainanense]|uniref:Aminotransferase class I/II-fold pyridoxal phosphate-dependent enzyme n=1 Tax=Brachybacterium hainanense TaxID=1541174 RepID=A0ABV6R654_9MICO
MPAPTGPAISGSTAAEIADSIRALIERGALSPGDALPPVRSLAQQLGVNRNTATAAYRRLAESGAVRSQGRAGTHVASAAVPAREGYTEAGALRDVAAGNPSPALIPDLRAALAAAAGRPVLYGEAAFDPGFEDWARAWMAPDVPVPADELSLSLAGGAVDALERLLAQALMRDDLVALEDPCFLASIHTVRLGGYRALPVPMDEEGMTPDGLRAALEQGARAVVCTPRAQNPTGASRTAARAAQLREVLADHPYVLVIEDDYYSLLSRRPFHPIIGPEHRRWALVRSVSKFAGPDLCLAVLATDPRTAQRLSLRLGAGTTWVSHLLQRIGHAVLRDPAARELIEEAGALYARRNAEFARLLGAQGIEVPPGDGLSLWVPLRAPAQQVAHQLMRRGWLARTGDEFRLDAGTGQGGEAAPPSRHLRLTVHELEHAEAERLAADLAAAIAESG